MFYRLLVLVAIVSLTSCATRQDAPSNIASSETSADSEVQVESFAQDTKEVTAATLAAEKLASIEPSVYFDYDRFEIKEQYSSAVEAFAEFLRTHPRSRVLIEGNCDERGTIEYNLALGQKRADAVKSALIVLGINETRIETISNGEEMPRNDLSTEAAFSVNRRADLISR